MSGKNYYEILDVPQDASPELINKVRRKRLAACHPDVDADEKWKKFAHERTIEISKICAVLLDPKKRAKYDQAILPPKPEIFPIEIEFGVLAKGSTASKRVTVTNKGGEQHAAAVLNLSTDSWFQCRIIKGSDGVCPIEIEVVTETTDLEEGKSYSEWIEIDLDGVTARATLNITVKAVISSSPSGSHSSPSFSSTPKAPPSPSPPPSPVPLTSSTIPNSGGRKGVFALGIFLGIIGLTTCAIWIAVVIFDRAGPGQRTPSAAIRPTRADKYVFLDELDGTSSGKAYGLEYERTANGYGAVFRRHAESRIEYASQIPEEGTLEWRIKIDSGYEYKNFTLSDRRSSALVFTTVGPDVWYPGSTWLTVENNGTLRLDMATTKYDGPKQTLEARNTNFRFGRWHSIGITYGRLGQQIKLDGVMVASDPKNFIKLSTGGDHDRAYDVPTIGEMKSVFWRNNQYESGFEGTLDRFRISNKQMDWSM